MKAKPHTNKEQKMTSMRLLASFLLLALTFPNPALALRQTGLEEQDDPLTGLPTRDKEKLVTALLSPVGNWENAPVSQSAAGLEERRGMNRRNFLAASAGAVVGAAVGTAGTAIYYSNAIVPDLIHAVQARTPGTLYYLSDSKTAPIQPWHIQSRYTTRGKKWFLSSLTLGNLPIDGPVVTVWQQNVVKDATAPTWRFYQAAEEAWSLESGYVRMDWGVEGPQLTADGLRIVIFKNNAAFQKFKEQRVSKNPDFPDDFSLTNPQVMELVKEPAITVLGIYGVHAGLEEGSNFEIVAEASRSPHWSVRLGAVHALDEMKNTEADAVLIEVLKDQDEEHFQARDAAVTALGYAYRRNPAVLPAILSAASDSDWQVRLSAVRALAGINTPESTEVLRNIVQRGGWEDSTAKDVALEALAKRSDLPKAQTARIPQSVAVPVGVRSPEIARVPPEGGKGGITRRDLLAAGGGAVVGAALTAAGIVAADAISEKPSVPSGNSDDIDLILDVLPKVVEVDAAPGRLVIKMPPGWKGTYARAYLLPVSTRNTRERWPDESDKWHAHKPMKEVVEGVKGLGAVIEFSAPEGADVVSPKWNWETANTGVLALASTPDDAKRLDAAFEAGTDPWDLYKAIPDIRLLLTFTKSGGGIVIQYNRGGLEEETVEQEVERIGVVEVAVENKMLILGPEAAGILQLASHVRPSDTPALPIVVVVENADQRVAVERWAQDLMVNVEIIDVSTGIYALAPYNGNVDIVLRDLARYYASEKGMVPMVARTLSDLLEVTTFLGIPQAQFFAYQVQMEIREDLERYNL
ncbi:MAG: HEAT repeat domain-containing protein [Candidatus Omnitrophica bacterium]|nr:HEAT repeat domain-containing protein [Candidatus Omnitrophota bacterium]